MFAEERGEELVTRRMGGTENGRKAAVKAAAAAKATPAKQQQSKQLRMQQSSEHALHRHTVGMQMCSTLAFTLRTSMHVPSAYVCSSPPPSPGVFFQKRQRKRKPAVKLLATYSPAYLLACLRACLLACMGDCLPAYLSSYLSV